MQSQRWPWIIPFMSVGALILGLVGFATFAFLASSGQSIFWTMLAVMSLIMGVVSAVDAMQIQHQTTKCQSQQATQQAIERGEKQP